MLENKFCNLLRHDLWPQDNTRFYKCSRFVWKEYVLPDSEMLYL